MTAYQRIDTAYLELSSKGSEPHELRCSTETRIAVFGVQYERIRFRGAACIVDDSLEPGMIELRNTRDCVRFTLEGES